MKKGTIIAVCGKGGVGKTVTSGALVRTLSAMGHEVLAIDADPAMGLSFILGLKADIKTLASVRRDIIDQARTGNEPEEIADAMEYLVLESLIETGDFSFMAMGRSRTRGCFCPVNTLLRRSVKKMADNYDCVVVDAEAGLEQINREVLAGVSHIAAVIDGSCRSLHSLELIREMTSQMKMETAVGMVFNRFREQEHAPILEQMAHTGIPVWGTVPEDDVLRNNDTLGKPIFDLAPDSPVLKSVRQMVHFLIPN